MTRVPSPTGDTVAGMHSFCASFLSATVRWIAQRHRAGA